MGLFGDIRPKGITEQEMHYIQSELSNGAHHLNHTQVEIMLNELRGYMDSDNVRHPDWKQINDGEVKEYESHLASEHVLHLTPDQENKVKAVLDKYININRTSSFL
jgi:hypothetical protein